MDLRVFKEEKPQVKRIENKEDNMDMLLEADPSKTSIMKYLKDSDVYGLKLNDEIISLAVILPISNKTLELKNLVTKKEYRNKGYAKRLLKHLCRNYKQKYDKMIVGTTENNIPFYVKQGFDKYEKTIKNYFIDNYDEEYMLSKLIPGIDRFEGIRDFEKIEKLSFDEWIEDLEQNKHEENLPESYSPHTLYLAINDNNEIVGCIGIRWKQVPILMTFGGLIGYSIRPSQRGKGYASEMLKLALEKFANTSIDNILITCKDFNFASKKVIEKNGGIFENTYTNKDDGYTYLRYWIKNRKSEQ